MTESSSPSASVVMNKGLFGVAWPLFISLALSISLNFVDSFFLSRISDDAAAAGGALLPLLGSMIVMFSAVGQAGSSVAAQHLGARRGDDVPLSICRCWRST